jgi:hypothetical protein
VGEGLAKAQSQAADRARLDLEGLHGQPRGALGIEGVGWRHRRNLSNSIEAF